MYLRTAVFIIWLAMTAWLVRYEAFPELFTHSISGYRGLLSRELMISDSWMKIMFRGASLGYSHSSMDINENDTREHYVINNRIQIAFSVAGARKNIHILSSVILDADYTLQRFTFSMSSPVSTIRAEGVHLNKSDFNVTIATDSGIQRVTVQIPVDAFIGAPVSETGLRQLKPGEEISISTIDPTRSFKKTRLLFRCLRNETIRVSGDELDTTVVVTEYQGIKVFSWLDKNGSIVRQESQIGVSMQKCTPEEAFEATLSPSMSDEMIRKILPFMSFPE